jgi:ketosteroid isomerase-like protein
VSDELDPVHRLVRSWAQAVNARDADTVVALSHPDIELYPMQIAVSGHYSGHDGVRQWIAEIAASGIGHQVTYRGIRTLPDGRVALFGEVCLEGTVISPYSLIVTVRDERIALTRSYLADEETLRQLKLLR